MAIKDYHELLIVLRQQDVSYSIIAEKLGYKRDSIKHYCQRHDIRGSERDLSIEARTAKYIKRFNKKFPQFDYVSGYESLDSTITVRCKVCGHVQERHANSKSFRCDGCVDAEREARYKQEQKEKRDKKRKENEYTDRYCEACGLLFTRRGNAQKFCSDECFNEANNIQQIKVKKCVECGEEFDTCHDGNKYCSDSCRRKRANRLFYVSKDKRLGRNGKPDHSITLDKLIKRDGNTCYICGGKCDGGDYTITEEGYFITGGDYPSIDHVFPIAKGGLHQWGNVKLAHMKCNATKRDKIIIGSEAEQLRAI
jgi:hypothetical protein